MLVWEPVTTMSSVPLGVCNHNVLSSSADKSYLIVARIEKVVTLLNQTTYLHAKRNIEWNALLERTENALTLK